MHPAIVRLVFDLIPSTVLVTDAIDAAGVGDGRFELGGQEVLVQAGEARLSATGSLAGSTLTMDQALRNAVKLSGLSIERASAAASLTPARALGPRPGARIDRARQARGSGRARRRPAGHRSDGERQMVRVSHRLAARLDQVRMIGLDNLLCTL